MTQAELDKMVTALMSIKKQAQNSTTVKDVAIVLKGSADDESKEKFVAWIQSKNAGK